MTAYSDGKRIEDECIRDRLLGLDARYWECRSHSRFGGNDGCGLIFMWKPGARFVAQMYEDLPPDVQQYLLHDGLWAQRRKTAEEAT